MILTKKVHVCVSGRNGLHYSEKGYELPYSEDKRNRIGIKKGSRIWVDVYDLHKYSQEKIKYKCDVCGSIKEVVAQTIFGRKNSQYNKTGETFCSNCANKKMYGKNSGAYKHGSVRYPEYRYNARKRKIKFNLSPEQFKEIISKECHYCGGFSIDRNKKSSGNGVDRKDSAVGYVLHNCVPCCATCNFIKNNMRYKDFIDYIKKLYNNIIRHEV